MGNVASAVKDVMGPIGMDAQDAKDVSIVANGDKRFQPFPWLTNFTDPVKKCIFQSPELPCTMCQERGLSCDVDENVFRPKTELKQCETQALTLHTRKSLSFLDRPLSSPGEYRFTAQESLHIHDLFGTGFFWAPLNISCDGRLLSVPARKDDVMKRIASLLFTFSSPTVRYAILAYASFCFNKARPKDSFYYLGLYYQYLRKAISSTALVDIVYASNLVCLLAREMGESLDVVSIHSLGLSQALKTLKSTPSTLTPHEWFSLEHSCQVAFVDIRNQGTPRLLMQSSLTEFRKSKFVYKIIRSSTFN